MLDVSKKQKEGQCGRSRADGAGLVRAEVRELPRASVLFKGKGVPGENGSSAICFTNS